MPTCALCACTYTPGRTSAAVLGASLRHEDSPYSALRGTLAVGPQPHPFRVSLAAQAELQSKACVAIDAFAAHPSSQVRLRYLYHRSMNRLCCAVVHLQRAIRFGGE